MRIDWDALNSLFAEPEVAEEAVRLVGDVLGYCSALARRRADEALARLEYDGEQRSARVADIGTRLRSKLEAATSSLCALNALAKRAGLPPATDEDPASVKPGAVSDAIARYVAEAISHDVHYGAGGRS